MRKSLKRYQLLLWISLLLTLGFVTVTASNYHASKDSLERTLTESTLPATGDHVYAEIQKNLLRPITISAQIAHNNFVRNWLLNGEDDVTLIASYLKEINIETGATSTALISDASKNYYTAAGLIKTMRENDSREPWYFRVKNQRANYETPIEFDVGNRDNITAYANYRINDAAGKFIGAVGVGMTLDALPRLIDSYQQGFQRRVSLIDKKGNFLLSGGGASRKNSSIMQQTGLAQIAKQILGANDSTPVKLTYLDEGEKVVVNARLIPELGWFLLVEQSLGPELATIQNRMMISSLVGGGAALLVVLLTFLSIRRYQSKIEQSAATDPLTMLLNRQAFDFVFQQAILDSERSRQPLCVALMDIDHFKKINDKQGHLIGDHVLKEIAMIAKRSLRESDVICRWGGEEFLILLKNCALEKATAIAENLRTTIAGNDFSRTTDLARGRLNLTVSMGVAECKTQESEDSVFDRAEVALEQAKGSGRNSVYFSE